MPLSNDQAQDRQKYFDLTKNHRMKILQDEGVYRHITMGAPNQKSFSFQITTIPNYLIVTGGLGSWVFSILHDMFELHRLGEGIPGISYDYMAEKLVSHGKESSPYEFDCEEFKVWAFDAFWHQCWFDISEKRRAWRDFRLFLERSYSDQAEAYGALRDDMCFHNVDFEDLIWENSERITSHFKTICWAVAETIRNYDLGGDKFDRQEKHDKLILSGRV